MLGHKSSTHQLLEENVPNLARFQQNIILPLIDNGVF